MSKIEESRNFEVTQELFRQLNASKVNGFPFLAYTGAKPSLDIENTAVFLKMPRNPKGVKNVLISYDYGRDTYTIVINGRKSDGESKFTDIYADMVSDLIVREMGVL